MRNPSGAVARTAPFARESEQDAMLRSVSDHLAEKGFVVALLDDVLLYHRMHEKNLTRRRAAASRDEFLDIVRASLDRRRAAGNAAQDVPPGGTGGSDKT